ncbi:putative colanic acid biosynthesis acetyltransferase [Hufsiella ginkgonis]|uniref:Putative colanic acid biosynthesis acetyltransferase n=1 Tax=Hufsiella ginkgonis TaxID=2695274 RepID=A0A7K1Y2E9_9SPHI|nr:putative colanic acid biosynthesis acetyltransferase [Hufsiella ginkgonis]MXV17440.1 putative colanic acid biosynthesis acetyltransferase [Hufsiella ginkgonis]
MVNQDTYRGPSFSLRNRLGRIAWQVTAFLLVRFSPRPLHGWRSFVLRCFGAKVGRGVHVYPNVKIWAPWNLQLDDECGIADGAILYSQALITVGKRAIISQGSNICTGTHDYTLKGHPLIAKPIVIGDEAWIASESFIHPGIIIGNGCVIGARSVVTKNMPEWMVCAGHPCKALKPRIMKTE